MRAHRLPGKQLAPKSRSHPLQTAKWVDWFFSLIELRFIKFRLISRVYQLEPALNLRESHCLSPDSTTSATPLGDPWVRPCAVPCLAGGPSPDILALTSLALPWVGVTSRACSGGS